MKKTVQNFSFTVLLFAAAGVALLLFTLSVGAQPFNRYQDEIERVEAELTQANLATEDRDSLERKLEIAVADATRMAGVYSRWTQLASGEITAAPTTNFIPTAEDPNAVRREPDGIYQDPPVLRPIPGGETLSAEVTSSWRKTTPQRNFFVLAGFVRDDPQQGMVLWQRPNRIFMDRFLTPTKSGAVRITEELNLVLVLRAENGDIFYFDAQGGRFIDSPDAATVTPLPTPPPPIYPYPDLSQP